MGGENKENEEFKFRRRNSHRRLKGTSDASCGSKQVVLQNISHLILNRPSIPVQFEKTT